MEENIKPNISQRDLLAEYRVSDDPNVPYNLSDKIAAAMSFFHHVARQRPPMGETQPEISSQIIEDLSSELQQIRNQLEKHNRLLSITNDLLLQMNSKLEIRESQAYFWTDTWIDAEHKADEDIKNNNIHTFNTSDQIIEFLRGSE